MKLVFQRDPYTGLVDHLAPFLVLDRANGPRSGIYEDEPRVCLEVEPDTKVAYFEAEWSEGRWMFGHRVPDPDWAEASEVFPWLKPEPALMPKAGDGRP